MSDRLHPGAGLQSFLHENNLWRGGGTVTLEQVANSSQEEVRKEVPTVPVTPLDEISSVSSPTGTIDKNDDPNNESTLLDQTVPESIPESFRQKYKETALFGTNSTVNNKLGKKLQCECVEGYCPCKDQFQLPGSNGSFVSSLKNFMKKEEFRSNHRYPYGALDKFKDLLTGIDKAAGQRNDVEKFCNEHWHGVAISIIATIVVVAISIVILIFLGVIKICTSCCDDSCGDSCCKSTGQINSTPYYMPQYPSYEHATYVPPSYIPSPNFNNVSGASTSNSLSESDIINKLSNGESIY